MLPAYARLTHLLELLESRRDWRAAELAAALGVTRRTVRNDVERLRNLGYLVEATYGAIGGYHLAPEGRLPPLHLDEGEAVAVTVALRYAAGRDGLPVSGLEEATLRAMLKAEHLLGVAQLGRADTARRTVRSPDRQRAALAARLSLLADACEQRQRVRFLYSEPGGERRQRYVNPHRLVHRGGRWHLVSWDNGAGEWNVFPVGQMRRVIRTAWQFRPQTLAESELSDLLTRTTSGESSRPG